MFEVVVALHHIVWNAIHLQMHKPEPVFFEDWRIYKWLTTHHYMHHLHPDRNFNVTFPLADYVLGTVHKPTQAELQEMNRLQMVEQRELSIR